jgi:hypothetical protein
MTKEEIDKTKKEKTVGEMIDEKMEQLIDVLNKTHENMYTDFNKGITNLLNVAKASEAELNKGLNILWGIVNEAQVRAAAIESILLKNGMKAEDIATEMEEIKDKMKQNGWKEMPLNVPSSPPEENLAPLA